MPSLASIIFYEVGSSECEFSSGLELQSKMLCAIVVMPRLLNENGDNKMKPGQCIDFQSFLFSPVGF